MHRTATNDITPCAGLHVSASCIAGPQRAPAQSSGCIGAARMGCLRLTNGGRGGGLLDFDQSAAVQVRRSVRIALIRNGVSVRFPLSLQGTFNADAAFTFELTSSAIISINCHHLYQKRTQARLVFSLNFIRGTTLRPCALSDGMKGTQTYDFLVGVRLKVGTIYIVSSLDMRSRQSRCTYVSRRAPRASDLRRDVSFVRHICAASVT